MATVPPRPSVRVVVQGWPWGDVRLVAWGRLDASWYGLVSWHEAMVPVGGRDDQPSSVVLTGWLRAGVLRSRHPFDPPVSVRRLVLPGGEWPPDDYARYYLPAYWHYGLLADGTRPVDVPGWERYPRRRR